MRALTLAVLLSCCFQAPCAWAQEKAAPKPGVAAARPAEEAGPDLGIPMSAPWEAGSTAQAAREEPPPVVKHPLEEDFPEKLKTDLAGYESARLGLLEGLAFARAHPEVFPPREPVRPGGLFDEHAELARRLWLFCADHYLALEAIVGRWREYPEMSEPHLRDAAFLLACSARLAQRRFHKDWHALFSADPEMRASLQAVREPGLPPGLLDTLLGAPRDEGLGVLAARRTRVPPRALAPYLGRGLSRWEKVAREDLVASGVRARPGPESALRAALGVEEPLLSRAAYWAPRPLPPVVAPSTIPVEERFEAGEDALYWIDLPVSSQAAIAVDKLKEVFDPDPPGGARPELLISTRQLVELAPLLEPGDIFLLRRELFMEGVGAGGWWRSAALYVGSPQARARLFGKEGVEGLLAVENPTALVRNALKQDPADVFWSDGRRADLYPLRAALVADALAVLRPRLTPGEKAQAVRRAFAAAGRAVPEACAPMGRALPLSAAAVWSAYPELQLPKAPLPEGSCSSADELVRRFDVEFGTEKARFDLIAFLDPREPWQRAGSSPLETFRASWRRSAWTPRVRHAVKESTATEARP